MGRRSALGRMAAWPAEAPAGERGEERSSALLIHTDSDGQLPRGGLMAKAAQPLLFHPHWPDTSFKDRKSSKVKRALGSSSQTRVHQQCGKSTVIIRMD